MTVIGIENEYGISVAGVSGDRVDPVLLSAAVVTAGTPLAAGWDFSTESPLHDLRGGHVPRAEASFDLRTDEHRHANRLLPNGARFYVDHAHPEYSGPEVRSARDAVLWDVAGDRIVQQAAMKASDELGAPVRVHKNNTDGKGASYGCHENYLLPRELSFDRVVAQFSAHLVTRQVICGAGRVGLGQSGDRPGFQLSQRADFFEERVGLETTIRRPVINTRDEPHADPLRWRRLHVITGDSLLSQQATLVKVGAAALVLQQITAQARSGLPMLPILDDPVTAMHLVSHDLSMSAPLLCTDGVSRSAIEMQRLWWQACVEMIATQTPWINDAEQVLNEWDDLLAAAESGAIALADRVDWAAKWRLLDGMRSRRGVGWDASELAAIDLQFHDLNPDVGLALKLQARGGLRSFLGEDEIAAAMSEAPVDTRAWLRGQIVQKFGVQLTGVSWDHLTLRTKGGRRIGIPMSDPLGFTLKECGRRLESVTTVEELAAALRR